MFVTDIIMTIRIYNILENISAKTKYMFSFYLSFTLDQSFKNEFKLINLFFVIELEVIHQIY